MNSMRDEEVMAYLKTNTILTAMTYEETFGSHSDKAICNASHNAITYILGIKVYEKAQKARFLLNVPLADFLKRFK